MTTTNPALPRPTDADCGGYWLGYAGKVEGSDVLAALQQEPKRIEAWFSSAGEDKAGKPYAEGKWSPKQLLGHLIDTERMFGMRTMALARGETQDLFGFDQDVYVAGGAFDDRSVASLMEEYRGLRASHVALFASLSPEQAARRGRASGGEFTARAFPWILAGHEIHHLAILEERYSLE